MSDKTERILVIKLGALGDFIQALGPMRAIREHHKQAHISLLTTKPFAGFARACGYFDEIMIDPRPKWFDVIGCLGLRRRLNDGGFARVYDLQNNDRTNFYFKLLKAPKPEWVGVAKGASHRNISPERTAGHALDGHVQTLELAGITGIQPDPMAWMQADIAAFGLPQKYVLLVPGSAPQHPQKRWSAAHYGALAKKLSAENLTPVILGAAAEQDIADEIKALCPAAINVVGRTTLEQIVVMARDAHGAIGNDTGPMHLIAATGCRSLVLFSGHSMPHRHCPKGAQVDFIQQPVLSDLDVDEVFTRYVSA